MICVYCGYKSTDVTNSRPRSRSSGVWRRRQCGSCKRSFTTDETARNIMKVIKSDARPRSTNLSMSRLTISIWKSFQHDPNQGSLVAGDLTQSVISALTPATTVSPQEIAETTYQIIRRYDESAGIAYALQHHLLTSVKRRGRPSLASPGTSRDEHAAVKPTSPYQSHQTYRDTFRAPDESAR